MKNVKLHYVEKNDSKIFKYVMISILLLSNAFYLKGADYIKYDVNQLDNRIYVEFNYTTWTLGSQIVNIHVTNNTSDKLNVKLSFTVYGSNGEDKSQEIGIGGGYGLDIKPGARMGGDINNCMMMYDKHCGEKNALSVQGGSSCIQNITYKIISITNLSEQERKDKAQQEKADQEKEAKRVAKEQYDKAIAEKQKANEDAQQKKADQAVNQQKNQSQSSTSQYNSSQNSNQSNTSTNSQSTQKSQTQINAENRASQEDYERRKQAAAEEQARKVEEAKREMANQEEQRIRQNLIAQQESVQALSSSVGNLAESVLTQKGGRIGVLIGEGNSEVYGGTFGDNNSFQANIFFTEDFKTFGLSMDLLATNAIKMMGTKEISNTFSVCPSLGYIMADGTAVTSGPKVNYSAITVGVTAYINIGTIYLKCNYSINAFYIDRTNSSFPELNPTNETYFSIGAGFGF